MHPYLQAAAPSQYPYSMLSGHDQLAAAWQHQAASMYHAGLRASSPYGLPITSAGLPRYVLPNFYQIYYPLKSNARLCNVI